LDEKIQKLIGYASTWWGKTWIRSMLKYGRFYRMQRAINYANDNRISDVIIRKGEIFAQCQGTAPVPYRIKIKFQPLTSTQWDKIIMKMNSQAYFEASLLSGQMPININKIFVDVGVPLFPIPKKKINANCNCPDNENVCKHVAALILTLAKIFDYDPFKLLEYNARTHLFVPHRDIENSDLRERIKRMLKILQVNHNTVCYHRKTFFNRMAWHGNVNTQPEIDCFFTAYQMATAVKKDTM